MNAVEKPEDIYAPEGKKTTLPNSKSAWISIYAPNPLNNILLGLFLAKLPEMNKATPMIQRKIV